MIAIAAALCASAAAAEPVVKIQQGQLAGSEANGVETYRAIPYAKPPVGALRWKPPQAAPSWTGVRPATVSGPICMQPSGAIPGKQSEDCLTLEIFTAARAAKTPAPVLVWIHGGGFAIGAGSTPDSNGEAFAKSGVVVVNINYRLGRFGFFAHPSLSKEAGGKLVANYGLMDQIAALKWVKANIKAFGGDPNQITIAGGSAGGASTLAMMISPQARGLFQRAITESGLGREQTLDLAGAEQSGQKLAARWGVAGSTPEALRAVSADTIIATEKGDINSSVLNGDFPIIDGQIMPTSTFAAFKAGKEAKIPWIVGSMDTEVPPGVQPAVLKAKIPAFDALDPEVQAAYGSASQYANSVASDIIFAEPSTTLAKLHARFAPTYVYRFGIVADSLKKMMGGAVHGTEGPYVFSTYKASPIPIGPAQQAQGLVVHDYWAAFIAKGDPNGGQRPIWPTFNDKQLIYFTNDGPQIGPDPIAARLAVVSKALEDGRLPNLVRPVPPEKK